MLTPEELAAGRRLHGLAIGEESTALERVEWRIWVDDHVTALLDMAEAAAQDRRPCPACVARIQPVLDQLASERDEAIGAAREVRE